ncbi:hypothetical protein B4U80_04944 [Leptotrombidium deliense]|uniref:Uncharacterized protein n=1 Tax=Leptotrombidium deliense TaxID=299467 RepID=A0A443RSC6_9ACAR|nr:hypothetical protein B4U80_04944 [Leptotrombidium deliense]
MLRTVKEDDEGNTKKYYELTRHTIQVDWFACMDEIATLSLTALSIQTYWSSSLERSS